MQIVDYQYNNDRCPHDGANAFQVSKRDNHLQVDGDLASKATVPVP